MLRTARAFTPLSSWNSRTLTTSRFLSSKISTPIQRTFTDQPHRTECYDIHVKLGGKMVPFAGFSMPLQYSNQGTVAAHKHTRTQAGIFDVSHMAQLEIGGKDRVEFLEKVLVGGIKELQNGQATLSLITNKNGGIIDDTVVSNQGETHYMVINASRVTEDIRHLEKELNKFVNENTNKEVTIRVISRHSILNEYGYDHPHDESQGAYALFALQGPHAADVLQSLLFNSQINQLKELKFMNSAEFKLRKKPNEIRLNYYNANLDAVNSNDQYISSSSTTENSESSSMNQELQKEKKKKKKKEVEEEKEVKLKETSELIDEENHIVENINYYNTNLEAVVEKEKIEQEEQEREEKEEEVEEEVVEENKEEEEEEKKEREIEEENKEEENDEKPRLDPDVVQINYYYINANEHTNINNNNNNDNNNNNNESNQEQSDDGISHEETEQYFGPCLITRCGYTGEDGFEIRVKSEEAPDVFNAILSVSPNCIPEHIDTLTHPVVHPIGLGARDSLRLEAGLCLYGHDIDETITPVEASLSWTIPKRRKEEGGFLGSEVILRQLKEGVSRKRIGFALTGPGIPREGDDILDETGKNIIGKVSSGGFSPTLNKGIGMGLINSSSTKIGTKLIITNEKNKKSSKLNAVVTKTPFVQTKYFK